VFNQFFVYDSPFFRSQAGILGRLLGGWNIAPIFSASSGVPASCRGNLSGTRAQEFGSADGLNFTDFDQCRFVGPVPTDGVFAGVAGANDSAGDGIGTRLPPGTTAQFNAFKNPLAVWNSVRPAILGIDNGHDGGFGVLRGIPFWNLDVSVKKNIRISERFSTTFQTVFTNVLNHNQFANGTINLSNPNCVGVISSACSGGPQIDNPRQIEMSLRVNF
jgi:hypothetical protein